MILDSLILSSQLYNYHNIINYIRTVLIKILNSHIRRRKVKNNDDTYEEIQEVTDCINFSKYKTILEN